MIPLSLAETGKEQIIRKVGGNPQTRLHLENLGFTVGGSVTIVSSLSDKVTVAASDVTFFAPSVITQRY